HRDRVVRQRVAVDGDAIRRAGLVLASITPADRALLVVKDVEALLERRVDRERLLRHAVLLDERKDRGLDRRETRMQLQHGAGLATDLVLAIRVAEERERSAVRARRRLDDVRQVATRLGLLLPVAEVAHVLASHLHVLPQVEAGAIRDALELAAPERKVVLDVRAARGIVRELVRLVLAQVQVLAPHAELDIPLVASLAPVPIPVGGLCGPAEELD